ncbi:MAG: flavonol synthase [Hirschia sp.]|nr:flavonol synthase [Hirschia sp.]MBF18366.1 flavonol synthase [Hirschia sp.]
MKLRETDPQAFAQALGDSFQRYGFGVVADHGLDQTVIDTALEKARAFFAMSDAEKRSYHIAGGGGQRGYIPFGQEIAKGFDAIDLKEFWHIGRELPPGHPYSDVMPPNVDVDKIANWHQASYAMYDALDALGGQILASIATYLGIEENWFADTVRDGNSVLRLLHYPAQTEPPPEGSVRAAEHGDINVITLLLGAEEGGLEVKDRDGTWLPINPPPNCIVVNMGDMLERLTNNYLPSTLHRVVNPKPERARFARYSTPFFLHFRPDFLIETLDSCISDDTPNAYPEPITANDFLMQRLREINLI